MVQTFLNKNIDLIIDLNLDRFNYEFILIVMIKLKYIYLKKADLRIRDK